MIDRPRETDRPDRRRRDRCAWCGDRHPGQPCPHFRGVGLVGVRDREGWRAVERREG